MKSKIWKNKKFVVRVFIIYPVWGMGQLSGAVISDNEGDAFKIAKEIKGDIINTSIEEMDGNIESELWKEWAGYVEALMKNNHYDVDGLNIITAKEYYENGFEFVEPDFSDAVFDEDGEFLGWYDADKDAVVDAEGNIVGRFDDKGKFIKYD